MDTFEKTIFTKLNKNNKYFSEIIKKITIGDNLTNKEYSYVLLLSTIFYDEYANSKKNGYFEFSYYLVLNYSIKTQDFRPLLMFSINNGLYPIAKAIFKNYEKTSQDILLDREINNYKKGDIYELKKQFESIRALVNSSAQNKAYIAPTSYGKSSAIIEDIKKNQKHKIGIIVPKKALIWQMFRNVKTIAKELEYKVLLYDSDYNNEEKVICIFTQERAIRLIQDSNFYFDTLYIDEAHNLFEKDDRNILLARLIKLNKKINPKQNIIFLSPLVKDANDLTFEKNEFVEMQKIDFNIKEPYVRFFNNDNKVEVYNRFVNSYYYIDENYVDYYDYIQKNLGNKNLFYFFKPKDIEKFSQQLLDNIKSGKMKISKLSYDDEIMQFSSIISRYVDKDYYLVELIKYGIVYLHGKMPDSIKDYVINKFTSIKNMKILISNSSVLEGMNLSIDSLFIFDVYRLNKNNLINLCGRVNRLNDIFSQNNLSKLFCNIHFVDIHWKKIDFKNKISLLRSDEEDEILNPLLEKTILDEKGRKIAKRENDFINNYKNDDVKTILIKNDLASMYNNIDLEIEHIKNSQNDLSIKNFSIFKKISTVFFNDRKNVLDIELARLVNKEVISFYDYYTSNVQNSELTKKVKYFFNHFKNSQNEEYYIGESFGEIFSKYNPNKKVYINIKNKTDKELINLAIIKTKIEDDFISFKIGKLVKTLFDLKIINEEEYNKFLYGTNDNSKIQLIKMGLSTILLKFIENNNLENEYSVKNGMIETTDKFNECLNKEDDFIKFEIKKFIS